jgi:hypothetical protein
MQWWCLQLPLLHCTAFYNSIHTRTYTQPAAWRRAQIIVKACVQARAQLSGTCEPSRWGHSAWKQVPFFPSQFSKEQKRGRNSFHVGGQWPSIEQIWGSAIALWGHRVKLCQCKYCGNFEYNHCFSKFGGCICTLKLLWKKSIFDHLTTKIVQIWPSSCFHRWL